MIRIKGLSKSFGKLKVLRSLNATIQDKKITAIVGHNGSGKTTLIKCILGLDKLDSGKILIDGFNLNGDWSYRKHIGYMPQMAQFPENLTGEELLDMIIDIREQPEHTKEVLVEHFKLKTELKKPLKHLSGGTRQKINVILALMFDPQLLLLDEPSSGLDPVSSSLLKDMIMMEKARGKTIIITSHIMSEIQELADTILYLVDGQIIFDGPVLELIRQSGEKNLERAVAKMMS
ncbi:MAG: ABC transporter ATP-binding protein [Candidatus Marinimicrobia bacterium]|nr:ABC transporter ATP-binding protein [Candidatus Neomarinimicrobiota bacterium]